MLALLCVKKWGYMKIEPLGLKGKKLSKLIMIFGLILVISGFSVVAFFGLGNLPQPIFNFIFLLILLGLIIFSIGYSGYSGKVIIPSS